MYCSSPAAACTSLTSEYTSSHSLLRTSLPMPLPSGVSAPFPPLKFSMLISFFTNLGSGSQVNSSPLQWTTRLSTPPVLERPGPGPPDSLDLHRILENLLEGIQLPVFRNSNEIVPVHDGVNVSLWMMIRVRDNGNCFSTPQKQVSRNTCWPSEFHRAPCTKPTACPSLSDQAVVAPP